MCVNSMKTVKKGKATDIQFLVRRTSKEKRGERVDKILSFFVGFSGGIDNTFEWTLLFV